jgi:Kef-type K+ transport system membrane component KefB
MSEEYQQLALLLLLAATAGAIAVRLRQPLIVAFLLTGVVAGPAALGWVAAHGQIELLAQVGVTVLLFVVGLKLDLHLVKNLGPVALATGLGQLAFTIFFGYLIALAFGMPHVKALYVAVALTFSSTIIIVKLLSDKREIDSLHGRIAMGFLIVQDIAVVIAMMLLGSYHVVSDQYGLAYTAFMLVLKIGGAGLLIALLMRYVLPRLLHHLARSQELLLVFAIAWGTAFAALGEAMGFSKEVGAFLAGFSLASTTYREAISARLASIRDFLLLFFFIDMGAKLDLSLLGQELPAAGAFSLFVLIGNPLIVMAIMGYMGYRKRTGFLAGLTVAQISEFSIVFVAMGITLGHVGVETLGLVTLVGLVTITSSTYLILYSHQLYGRIAGWLHVFERANPFRELAMERGRGQARPADVLIYGLGRYGSRLAELLRARDIRVLGVEFDPEVVRQRRRQGFDVRFGDAEDPEFPETLPLGHVRWVISTLPQPDINLTLVEALRNHGYRGQIAMAAHSEEDARALERAGVDRVLAPYADAADFAARTIATALGAERAA